MSWNMRIAYCKSNDTWMLNAYKPNEGSQKHELLYIAGRHSRLELEPIIRECEGKYWSDLPAIKNRYRLRGA